jgi:CrcB protein
MIKDLLLVGAGSCLGGMARYLVAQFVKSSDFPWATMTANIAGCLLIGMLWAGLQRLSAPVQLNLFLVTGFCGGFTTFSTYSKESLALLQSGCYQSFCLYAAGSVLLGISAVFVGFFIMK